MVLAFIRIGNELKCIFSGPNPIQLPLLLPLIMYRDILQTTRPAKQTINMLSCTDVGMQFNNLITPEKVKPFLPICPIRAIRQHTTLVRACHFYPSTTPIPSISDDWLMDCGLGCQAAAAGPDRAKDRLTRSFTPHCACSHEETICSDCLPGHTLAIAQVNVNRNPRDDSLLTLLSNVNIWLHYTLLIILFNKQETKPPAGWIEVSMEDFSDRSYHKY